MTRTLVATRGICPTCDKVIYLEDWPEPVESVIWDCDVCLLIARRAHQIIEECRKAEDRLTREYSTEVLRLHGKRNAALREIAQDDKRSKALIRRAEKDQRGGIR